MTGSSFTAASLKRTQVALKLAEAKVRATAPTAEERSAEQVAQAMAARAPVNTGALKRSIHAEGSSALADVRYAIPVDRGTVNQAPQPFAESGAKAAEPQVIATMVAVFRAALGGK